MRAQDMSPCEVIKYWRKVKETIHVFDKIIVQYIVQWSAIMLGMIGVSAAIYPSSSLFAGIISLTAIVVSAPIALKCYFYYQLLQESLEVAIGLEKLIFKDESDFKKFGLTYRLGLVSTRPLQGITYFGWTIFLPFLILAASSATLSLFYFDIIATPLEAVLSLSGIIGLLMIAIFAVGFAAKFGHRVPGAT